ncbi:hypothetical protein [Actinoplanes sp. CA-252034]|uniref:hypothetical protein n=1 Tax=Actinoplanes sp. CA-252034 TaxID=3239906 RepID=UPI003D97FDA5
MTPDQHAVRAEALLEQSARDEQNADRLIARAHVHALLALRRRAAGASPARAEDSVVIHYGDGDPTHDRM